MPTRRALPCVLAAMFLVAACGDTPAGPDPDLTRAEADALAAELDGVAAGVIDGTCAVDVVSVRDPATRTATVTGTFCGCAVNVTRTRP